MMEDQVQYQAVAEAPADVRRRFLQQVALQTMGGLTLTAVVAMVSMFTVVPAVFALGKWGMIIFVYACIFGAQALGRKLAYGNSPAAGLVVGAGLQGMALGFLLTVAIMSAGAQEGIALIGYSLLMVVLAVGAMLLYVTQEKREFSMLRAGLAMMGIPMLIVMGLQLFLPMDGTLGLVISGVFLAISVGSLLYTLNKVLRDFPAEMPTPAAFELTIGIVIFYWNLLSFFLRMRRR